MVKDQRPSKTSKAQDQRLKAYVEKYPCKSARQLKNEVVGGLQKKLQKSFFDFRASVKNICTLEPHMKLATFVVGSFCHNNKKDHLRSAAAEKRV